MNKDLLKLASGGKSTNTCSKSDFPTLAALIRKGPGHTGEAGLEGQLRKRRDAYWKKDVSSLKAGYEFAGNEALGGVRK